MDELQTKEVRLTTGELRIVEWNPITGSQKCASIKRGTGELCGNWAMVGGYLCDRHMRNKGQRVKAAVVAELSQWSLNDATEDPGEVLLRLVTQSARRAAFYASLIEQAYNDEAMVSLPKGIQALIGGTFSATAQGDVYQTGEQIRGLVALEAQERDRCANFATKAIAAGLAERQVRVAERQGVAIVEAITAALDHLGITGVARQEAQNAAADRLLAIAS